MEQKNKISNGAKKILIVEDDLVLLNLLKDKIIKAGYNAISLEKGSLVLKTIEEERPDLILLDLVLPDMSGMEILEKIRDNVLLSHMPVIIISNSGEKVELDRAKKLGISDFLIKTEFDPQEVVSRVNIFFNQGSSIFQENTVNEETKINLTDHSVSYQPAEKIKVMIIEDDKFLRELISQKIIRDGMSVMLASSVEEANTILEKEKPTIILLDIILPGLSGFDFLKAAKSNSSLSSIPVIILSNLGEEKEREMAMNLGAKSFLVKAMHTPNEIVAEIKHVLEKSYL